MLKTQYLLLKTADLIFPNVYQHLVVHSVKYYTRNGSLSSVLRLVKRNKLSINVICAEPIVYCNESEVCVRRVVNIELKGVSVILLGESVN